MSLHAPIRYWFPVRVPLGKIVVGFEALVALTAARVDLLSIVSRHAMGDWGEASSAEDIEALENGQDVTGFYIPPGTNISVRVTTGGDRRLTLVEAWGDM
jgi:hypothetical protein